MKTQTCTLLLISAMLAAACGGEPPPAADVPPPAANESSTIEPVATLAELLASDSRSEEDRARDAGRKPAEVIAAMGIEPGMQILEILAGGGWFTEVLSIAVGSEGHVTAHNTPGSLQMRDGANEIALSARLAGDRLPNVSRLNKDFAEMSSADGQFDAALTALNLHDIYNNGGEEGAVAAVSAIYAMLRPGGFFVVIDHEGLEGLDNVALHRMVKADAVRVVEAVGFALDADSDVLHSNSDDMTQHMRTEGLRGFTNQFVLRFKKPLN